MLEKFEFSCAAAMMAGLRLGAGLLRQDGTGSGRESCSGASARANLIPDSCRGTAQSACQRLRPSDLSAGPPSTHFDYAPNEPVGP